MNRGDKGRELEALSLSFITGKIVYLPESVRLWKWQSMRWTIPYLPSSPPSCEGHLYLREALGFLPAAQQSGGHALRPFLRAGQAADLAERCGVVVAFPRRLLLENCAN